QQLANRFADRSAARFARDQKRNAGDIKTVREKLHLRRFSAALGALERDEWQTDHDLTSSQRSRFSSSKSQTPSAKEIPNLDFQCRGFSRQSLDVGACLGFGYW